MCCSLHVDGCSSYVVCCLLCVERCVSFAGCCLLVVVCCMAVVVRGLSCVERVSLVV